MIDFFSGLFASRISQSVLASFFIAGIIKTFFNYLGKGKLDLWMLFRTGGMPSSHTATVSAMTTSIYLLEGFSDLFFVSLIISMVIVSDAVGIRRAAGKQAQILNKIVQDFTLLRKFKTKRLYELLGHTPKQAIAGIFLGILVAHLIFAI